MIAAEEDRAAASATATAATEDRADAGGARVQGRQGGGLERLSESTTRRRLGESCAWGLVYRTIQEEPFNRKLDGKRVVLSEKCVQFCTQML